MFKKVKTDHTNFRKIYKDSFLIFRKYKLLRVFGATQVASEILLYLGALVIWILYDITLDYPTLLPFPKLVISTIDPNIKLFYYISLVVFGLFIVLFYLIIKNWAIACLIKSVQNINNQKAITLSNLSGFGKRYLKRLILLDLFVWVYYSMFGLLVSTAALYFSFMFPNITDFVLYTAWVAKILFYLINAIIVIFASRAIVLHDLTVLKGIRYGYKIYSKNISNAVIMTILNMALIGPFVIGIAFVVMVSQLLSMYLLDTNPVISLFFYCLSAAVLILTTLTGWIFYGSYQVFVSSVWTKFYIDKSK